MEGASRTASPSGEITNLSAGNSLFLHPEQITIPAQATIISVLKAFPFNKRTVMLFPPDTAYL
jgi:hypothetical protein